MSSRPEHGILIAKDVMVPMRDGVRLRDGHLPPGPRRRAGRRALSDHPRPHLVRQDLAPHVGRSGRQFLRAARLRGRAPGPARAPAAPRAPASTFTPPTRTKAPDGYDTIEWIAAQPWSNGRVGMVGSSHGAIVQQVAALYRPPHLTAIWPDVGPTNIYANEAREGGAMALHMFGALFLHAHDAQEIRDDPVARKTASSTRWSTCGELGLPHAVQARHRRRCASCPTSRRRCSTTTTRGAYDEWWPQDCMRPGGILRPARRRPRRLQRRLVRRLSPSPRPTTTPRWQAQNRRRNG